MTIDSHVGPVDGLRTTSAIYDLRAYDARTGAVIATFAVAPVLTVQVGAAAAVSGIYYLAADGTVQRQATTYDPATGVVTAALPHFSSYVTGSPLDGVVAFVVPQLQAWLATRAVDLPGHLHLRRRHDPGPGSHPRRRHAHPRRLCSTGSGPYTGTVTISVRPPSGSPSGRHPSHVTWHFRPHETLLEPGAGRSAFLAPSVTGFVLTMRSGRDRPGHCQPNAPALL